MIHKGELIEKKIRTQGYSITYVSKKLKKSRKYVYKIFEKQHIPYELIEEIGLIIQYDFSFDIPEMLAQEAKKTNEKIDGYLLLQKFKTEKEELKNKYYCLLEKYYALLNYLTDKKINNGS